jgi:hypothetical protein
VNAAKLPSEGDDRVRRGARNEVFFRESNEFLEQESTGRSQALHDFICECSSAGCLERLTLPTREYERVRERGDWFIVKPGHEDPAIEVVVERHPAFLVVQKTGLAGAIAEAEDPR